MLDTATEDGHAGMMLTSLAIDEMLENRLH